MFRYLITKFQNVEILNLLYLAETTCIFVSNKVNLMVNKQIQTGLGFP